MDYKSLIYPVVLSGGSGSRLWPLSREQSPKQFIPLVDNKSLLQNTCLRFVDLNKFEKPIIVCNENHRFQIAESLRDIDVKAKAIILEPIARNTAPAIVLAAFSILETDPEGIMLVLPADHHLEDAEELISLAIVACQSDLIDTYLFTFGIKPSKPETGYGYIKTGEELIKNIKNVTNFVEKPNLETAIKYINSKKYYWNSGMFLFKAKKYLEEVEKIQPEIYQLCKKSYDLRKQDLDFIRIDGDAFKACPSESIDYAILEKTKNIAVILLEKSIWSDIGSWEALFDLGQKDENGNIIKGDTFCTSVTNCYLQSHDRILAAVGVRDLIVVETTDAVLIANKQSTQDIKKIVKMLQHNNRDEVVKHKKHYSPWGYSKEISKGNEFVVKHLQFVVAGKTSLHKHHYRNEHLSILSGEAKIILDGKEFKLKAGDSFIINSGVEHQLINIGDSPLDMIEVWLGVKFDELDILRAEEQLG